MSGVTVQKKIDKAHKKIGNKLGSPHKLYTSLNNIEVLSDENLIGVVNATFTLSENYANAMGWGVPIWMCYTDAALLNQGDFLLDEETNRTFFIMARQPLQPVLAVEVPNRIDIKKVVYADTGDGFEPGTVEYIAKDLPAFVNYSSFTLGGFVPGSSVATAGVRKVEIITTLPSPAMLMGEALIDSLGFSGAVLSYSFSPIGLGVKITVQEMQAP